MIDLLVTLLIILIIFALLWWVLSMIPMPAGFPLWVVQVIFALVLVVVLLGYLLPFAGVRVR